MPGLGLWQTGNYLGGKGNWIIGCMDNIPCTKRDYNSAIHFDSFIEDIIK